MGARRSVWRGSVGRGKSYARIIDRRTVAGVELSSLCCRVVEILTGSLEPEGTIGHLRIMV